MPDLIPVPNLDLRDEEQFAAQAIALVTGGLTVNRINQQIAALRELIPMVEAGLDLPICPELTNANPSAPHTVLLEAQSWQIAQVARRINILPYRDQVEFARLFGIELRVASKATTNLTFTVAAPIGFNVTIVAGTEVKTSDGLYVFSTDEDLIILSGNVSGSVSATSIAAGKILLAMQSLTVVDDPIAYVTNVTNPAQIDSGTDNETVDQALTRARNYQRRGERLVSAEDFEDVIREDVLQNNGIVKAFPFIRNGEWETPAVGHTTIVVMTLQGTAVSDEMKHGINQILTQAVGNQFIYVIDPTFVDFNVEAQISVGDLVSPSATVAGVEKNLRDFYAARLAKFGVPALRSEIIAVIEGSAGVDHIVPDGAEILISPTEDMDISPYSLARLVNVTITVI